MSDRLALEAALASARALVATLEAAQANAAQPDELLDLVELGKRYGLGRAAVLAAVERGELEASRGVRGKILVSRLAIEEWRRSRPVVVQRKPRAEVVDLAAWEAGQERALARAGGAR